MAGNFTPLPEPGAGLNIIPVPRNPIDEAIKYKQLNAPVSTPETWRDMTAEELAKLGWPAGQVSSRGSKRQLKGVPLGAKEQTILNEAEQAVQAAATTAQQLQRAFELNDQAYSGGLPSVRMWFGRTLGSDDPSYVASEELQNLLGKLALSQLKTTFPGAVSDSERKVLMELQGSVNLPRAARARIYANAVPTLQNVMERNANRIKQIKSGYYSTRAVPVSPSSKNK